MYETNSNYVLFKLFNWNMFNYEGASFPMTRTTTVMKILKSKFAKSGCLCMASNSIHQHFSRWKVNTVF